MNTKTTLNKLKQNLQGQWALITGASSGMGRDYAHILAAAGADLVITARRTERLEQLAQEIRSTYHVRVEIMTSDLGMLGAGSELKKRIENKGIKIDVLINNAGLGLFGEFEKTPLEETLKMLQVDIVALTELTKIFVDDMKIRGRGHILLVGSVGAYQPTPTYAAYAAAKSYVLNFGEALSYELRSSGVKVSVLNPGITQTEFFEVAGQKPTLYQRLVMMKSHPVALAGLKALYKGHSSTVAGLLNQITINLTKFMPRSFQTRAAYLLMKN